MCRFKLTVLSGAILTLAWPVSPAVAAGPLVVPWAVGHLIGAAARLATLPLVAASAVSSAAPTPAPYYGPSGYYASPGYPAPGYYVPPAYAPTAFYAAPAPSSSYYGWPQHYYPAPAYRGAAPYASPMPRLWQSHRGYYAPGMRYSGSYGGQVFGPSRGFAHRRW